MGVAEVVGFAACWLVVAALMLWGVFTEKKRGPLRFEPPAGSAGAWHPSRAVRSTPAEWVVVEVAEGSVPRSGRRGPLPGRGMVGVTGHRPFDSAAHRRSHRGDHHWRRRQHHPGPGADHLLADQPAPPLAARPPPAQGGVAPAVVVVVVDPPPGGGAVVGVVVAGGTVVVVVGGTVVVTGSGAPKTGGGTW